MSSAIPLAHPSPKFVGWLSSARQDLLFVHGGVLVSLAMLAIHLGLGISGVVLWWTWIVLLDGPHIFATVSRTYLDKQERQQRARLLVFSLAWFFVGPLAFALSVGLESRLPLSLFLTFASVWAYWHVVRQHYGVMMLYKRKANESEPLDRRLDAWTLYVGLLAPFVVFALSQKDARQMLGLPDQPSWEIGVVRAAWALTALVVLVFAARQLMLARAGQRLNLPKVLVLMTTIGLAAIVFSPPIVARTEFIVFFVVLTAFHNVQYHAIVWFYHRNRYHAPGVEVAKFGLAPKLSASFLVYAGLGIAFTLLYRGLGCSLGAHPGCAELGSQTVLAGGVTGIDFAQALMWGFALHHYYLDQKIWRTRKDVTLRRDLKLQDT